MSETEPADALSFSSPERAALAAAIARCNAADAYRERVENKVAEHDHRLLDLYALIEGAEDAVAEAKAAEPQRLVAEALDGEPDPDALPSVAEAEAALAKLRVEQDSLRADLKLLRAEREKAGTSAALASSARNNNIIAVVKSEGNITELYEHYDNLRLQVASLERALGILSFALETDWHGRPKIDRPLAALNVEFAVAWQTALINLGNDANAAFPSLEDFYHV
jgi:hypothetical protein